ncbi:MAG: hypothetical protein ACRDB0_03080, partial [Paraclostridium sp.]
QKGDERMEHLFKGTEGGLKIECADNLKGLVNKIEKNLPEGTRVKVMGSPRVMNAMASEEGKSTQLPAFLESVAQDILSQIRETSSESEKTETEKKETKEETNSYVVIDEYGDTYTYRDVTKEELAELMDEDHDLKDEEIKLYELKPVEFSFKKTIVIK